MGQASTNSVATLPAPTAALPPVPTNFHFLSLPAGNFTV